MMIDVRGLLYLSSLMVIPLSFAGAAVVYAKAIMARRRAIRMEVARDARQLKW